MSAPPALHRRPKFFRPRPPVVALRPRRDSLASTPMLVARRTRSRRAQLRTQQRSSSPPRAPSTSRRSSLSTPIRAKIARCHTVASPSHLSFASAPPPGPSSGCSHTLAPPSRLTLRFACAPFAGYFRELTSHPSPLATHHSRSEPSSRLSTATEYNTRRSRPLANASPPRNPPSCITMVV